MQQDMFSELGDNHFQLTQKKSIPEALSTYHFDRFMVTSLATWVMLNPLGLTTKLFESFNEYADDVIEIMSTHNNDELMREHFVRAEKLVDIGYWKRYITGFTIKYQNPRSYAGKMITATLPVVCYGNTAEDSRLDGSKYSLALAMLCGQRIEDAHKYRSKVWKLSDEPVKDIFTYLTRKVKHISPAILRGRGSLKQ